MSIHDPNASNEDQNPKKKRWLKKLREKSESESEVEEKPSKLSKNRNTWTTWKSSFEFEELPDNHKSESASVQNGKFDDEGDFILDDEEYSNPKNKAKKEPK